MTQSAAHDRLNDTDLILASQDTPHRIGCGDVDIHAFSRPFDGLGGDVCEVVRLDERHLMITLADATGHDPAAHRMSARFSQSIRARYQAARLRQADPGELLQQVAGDLFDDRHGECHFVTAIHAVYNERSRVIRWARAGAPYPILLRTGHGPRRLLSEGPLLGVVPATSFEVRTLRLDPGDALLFHTDGLEGAVLRREGIAAWADMDRTRWYRNLRSGSIEAELRKIGRDLNRRGRSACDHAFDVGGHDDVDEAATATRDTAWDDDVSAVALRLHAGPLEVFPFVRRHMPALPTARRFLDRADAPASKLVGIGRSW
ncbi:MAG: PP2C family protein-serine/threonine phosphatase [Phycisphaerae bacterium]